MLRRTMLVAAVLSLTTLGWAAESITVNAAATGKIHDWDVNALVDSSYPWMVCGGSDGHFQRGLLKFPTIPQIAGKKIESATLHLYFGYTDGANPNLPLSISISTLQSDWDETTTWTTQPLVRTFQAGGVTNLPVNTYGWYSWDAKSAVQEWADGLENRSLQVAGDEALVQSNPGWQVLKYLAQGSNAGYVPYLEITYRTPAPGETTANFTATASGYLSDWDVYAPIDMSYAWMIAGSSDGHYFRSYLKFPQMSELAGKKVDRAILHLYYGYAGGANPNLPLTVTVNSLQSDWDDSTMWSTQPAVQTEAAGGAVSLAASATGWNTWDATIAVQEWADGLSSRSLQIKGDDAIVQSNPGWQALKYIFQATQAGYEPWIEVTYHTPLPGEGFASVKATDSGYVSDWDVWEPVNTTASGFIAGNSDGHAFRSLLKFPVIETIAGKTIDSAILHMNYAYSGGANSALPLTTRVFMLESDWTADTTFSTLPAIHAGSGYEGQVTATWLPVTQNGWNNTWNVTEAVQAWANGLGNTSLEIQGDETFVGQNPGWQVLKYFLQVNQTGSEPWIEIQYHTPATETVISGVVDLASFVGSKATIPVTIELLTPGTSTVVESHSNLTLDEAGNYSFTTTMTGSFDVVAKASHWLKEKKTNVTIVVGANTLDFNMATNGDINGDNIVNFSDYLVLSQNFGGSGPDGDLNGDDAVNFSDYLVLSQSFGMGGSVSADEVAQFKAASANLVADEESGMGKDLGATLPCSLPAMALLAMFGLALYSLSSLREQE